MAALYGLTGAAVGSSTTDVDTTQKHPLGTRAFDSDCNEYIYLPGCTSGAANLAVTYDEEYATTLTAASAVGPIAILQATLDATTDYGWGCVRGTCTGTSNNNVADNKTLVLTAGAGKLDDADVAGDQIVGLWSRGAATGSTTFTVQLDYPKAHGVAFD